MTTATQVDLGERARELFAEVPWSRWVALGDSITEGVGDSVDGYPDGGWVPMVGSVLSGLKPDFHFVNYGQRYLTTREIRQRQLEKALDYQPDLVTVVAGGNDLLLEGFDPRLTEAEFEPMVEALTRTGATVLTFTMFDIFSSGAMPPELTEMLGDRFVALNEVVRSVAERHSLLIVDLTSHPASQDPSIYSKDLQHANMKGHAVAAELVLDRLADAARATGR